MPMKPCHRRRILVAPLDWGLGHATRCIPVIEELRIRGCDIFLGGEGPVVEMVRSEFPTLRVLPLVNYNISYTARAAFLGLKFPFFVARVFLRSATEHRQIEQLITDYKIDAIISDQRFGCYSQMVPCAYISHQLSVKMPSGFGAVEQLVRRGLYHAADRYTQLWIPDWPGEDNLTGELSRKYPLPPNHRFIGLLSRFIPQKNNDKKQDIDLLVMLSGPEPQRTLLERRIRAQLEHFDGRAVVLLGRPEERETVKGSIEYIPHAPTETIADLLARAKAVVCRGGYSTIMELVSLGKKAVLIPTPGQTEQQYLARYLCTKGYFAHQSQKGFNLSHALAALSKISGPPTPPPHRNTLKDAIEELTA
ncbi:MAG: hypothetical protein GF344_17075 [Chitinivibrionales bacterium]|nr:hypothetical protein [Chitinivibrionales bacterium]MBD3358395.1 hypothetical protein [Chitinivibrionales bacterium]